MESPTCLMILLIMVLCLALAKGGVIPSIEEESGFARNKNEFLRCHGWKCEIWEEVKAKVKEIKMTIAEARNETESVEEFIKDNPSELEVIDGDIWPTPELAADILEGMKGRQKRKLAKFNKHNKIWNSPIGYVLQGNLSRSVKDIVRRAMHHWAAQTCIKFVELGEDEMADGLLTFEPPSMNLIYFQEGKVCSSYVGRIFSRQPIQLAERCGSNFGAVVHEIGHALGFWHEHQRSDRDQYVTMYPDNINENVDPWQIMHKGNTDNLVPYDYGSIMHYWAWAFTNSKGGMTIVPRDTLYSFTIGQKVGLSFLDSKLANMAYCKVKSDGDCKLCAEPVGSQPCQRQGYQDPNDCNRCRCPDGFAGRYCQEVAAPKKATCGGEFDLVPGQEHIVKSPNYDNGGPYQDFTECTWLFKAPTDYIPVFRMVPHDFGIYCNMPVCYHWLEIRFNNVSLTGPRFCCEDWSESDVKINGKIQEMMVLFRANTSSLPSDRRGFSAKVYLLYTGSDSPPAGQSTSKTPQKAPSTATTTTTTTRTTPSPKTTRTASASTVKKTESNENGNKNCDKGHREKVVDLAFVMDSSGSVGEKNWEVMKEFAINITREYSIGPDCMKVGFISFGTNATIDIYFPEGSTSKQALTDSIRRIQWKDGWSYTADGIKRMWTELFTSQRGDRTSARNMCILLTDGKSNVKSDQTSSEAAKAKFGVTNVHMVAIGITGKADPVELSEIASDSNLVFRANTFNDLPNLVENMLNEIDHYSELGPIVSTATEYSSSIQLITRDNTVATQPTTNTINPNNSPLEPHPNTTIHSSKTMDITHEYITTLPGSHDEPALSTGGDFSALDIAFVLDSSGSVGQNNWSLLLGFIRKFIAKIRIGKSDCLVSVVSFGNEASIHFDLTTYQDKHTLANQIYSEQIEWKDQWTNTASGLLVARNQVFGMRQTNRRWAKDVAILVTDGVSNRNRNNTLLEAESLRNAGVEIIVVGVGSRFDKEEGIAIAGSSSKLFTATSYKGLHTPSTIEGIMIMIQKEVARSVGSWSWDCDFEATGSGDKLCGMRQDQDNDDFDWTIWSEASPSEETGPLRAASGYFYLYTEASFPRQPGDEAIIYMPPFPYAATYCIEFQYIMNGYHVKKLALFRKMDTVNYILWYKEEHQGESWVKQGITVTTTSDNQQFGFISTRGNEFSGDIAIDDIHVTSGDCGHTNGI